MATQQKVRSTDVVLLVDDVAFVRLRSLHLFSFLLNLFLFVVSSPSSSTASSTSRRAASVVSCRAVSPTRL
jgi:hypothetical protein